MEAKKQEKSFSPSQIDRLVNQFLKEEVKNIQSGTKIHTFTKFGIQASSKSGFNYQCMVCQAFLGCQLELISHVKSKTHQMILFQQFEICGNSIWNYHLLFDYTYGVDWF